jgi:hypothetical protein
LTLSPADFRVKTAKSRCFLRGLKIRFRFSLHGADQQVEFIRTLPQTPRILPLFDPRET